LERIRRSTAKEVTKTVGKGKQKVYLKGTGLQFLFYMSLNRVDLVGRNPAAVKTALQL